MAKGLGGETTKLKSTDAPRSPSVHGGAAPGGLLSCLGPQLRHHLVTSP